MSDYKWTPKNLKNLERAIADGHLFLSDFPSGKGKGSEFQLVSKIHQIIGSGWKPLVQGTKTTKSFTKQLQRKVITYFAALKFSDLELYRKMVQRPPDEFPNAEDDNIEEDDREEDDREEDDSSEEDDHEENDTDVEDEDDDKSVGSIASNYDPNHHHTPSLYEEVKSLEEAATVAERAYEQSLEKLDFVDKAVTELRAAMSECREGDDQALQLAKDLGPLLEKQQAIMATFNGHMATFNQAILNHQELLLKVAVANEGGRRAIGHFYRDRMAAFKEVQENKNVLFKATEDLKEKEEDYKAKAEEEFESDLVPEEVGGGWFSWSKETKPTKRTAAAAATDVVVAKTPTKKAKKPRTATPATATRRSARKSKK